MFERIRIHPFLYLIFKYWLLLNHAEIYLNMVPDCRISLWEFIFNFDTYVTPTQQMALQSRPCPRAPIAT